MLSASSEPHMADRSPSPTPSAASSDYASAHSEHSDKSEPYHDADDLPEQLSEIALEGADTDHDSEERVKVYSQTCLVDAEAVKQEGNDYFRAAKWENALAAYRSALGRLPSRPKPKRDRAAKEAPEPDTDVGDKGKGKETTASPPAELPESTGKSEGASEVEPAKLTPLQQECAEARAVLNANIGACYVKLGEHKEAVAACTEALADKPDYAKVLRRRAQENEKLNTWSSLSSAQEDYTKLLDLVPQGSEEWTSTRRTLVALKPRVEAAQKQEMDEMWSKLKGVGNSILGNFGLSTDNFKMTPNGEGGYSMNFVS